MAVSGGVTTAYRCVVDAYQLKADQMPRLRQECDKVDEAVQKLERGETVFVVGSDMGVLRSRLASYGVG